MVHRSVLEQLPPGQRLETRPTFIVGVAQQDLFWKDIRQVLFSRARHTTFCRLETKGVADRWNPVKVADVLAGIIPRFDEMMNEFNEQVGVAMNQAPDASPLVSRPASHPSTDVKRTYVELLSDHHGHTLTPDVLNELTSTTIPDNDWLRSVDSRRPVFNELTQRVDEALGSETSREVAYQLRSAAVEKVGIEGLPAVQTESKGEGESAPGRNREERVLEAEIIAIYW